MYVIIKKIGTVMTVVPLLVASFGTATAVQPSSLIAHFNTESKTVPNELGINIVDQLRSKSDSTLKPFEKLVAKLARVDKSVCDLETESRFASVYRSLESDATENASLLDGARSLYSIRKAICETRATSTQIPAPCIKLLPTVKQGTSRRSIVESELQLATSSLVPSCLRQFQEHHYFWTSYSNNLQDSGSIGHLLRSDVEMRSMLMTYRDFEASMNDLRTELDNIRESNVAWHDEARRNAQDFVIMQDQTFSNFEQGFRNVSSTAMSGLETINLMLGNNEVELRKLSSKVNDGVSDVVKSLSALNRGTASMKRGIADIYNAAALEVISITQSQVDSLDLTYSSTTRQLSLVTQSVEAMLLNLSSYAELSEELRSRSLLYFHEQIKLSDTVFDKLVTTNEALNSTHDILGQISARTQDFGAIVRSVTELAAFAQQYKDILLALGIYIAVSVILAPLDGVVISRNIVSKVKAGYCSIQATLFLLGKLDLSSRFESAKHLMTWILFIAVILITTGAVIAVARYLTSKYVKSKELDIELAYGKRTQNPQVEVHFCDRQRRRREMIPRNARHGTAPPGL